MKMPPGHKKSNEDSSVSAKPFSILSVKFLLRLHAETNTEQSFRIRLKTGTLNKKNKAWEEIRSTFCGLPGCRPERTCKQLRRKWDNLKEKAKATGAKMHRYMLTTGGGPSQDDDEKLKDLDEKVSEQIKDHKDTS